MCNGIIPRESLDNVKGDNGSVQQYDRITLRSKERNGGMWQEKNQETGINQDLQCNLQQVFWKRYLITFKL